jgi:hypothetical protein
VVLALETSQRKISRVIDTMKIKAQTRSSCVGAWGRARNASLSTCWVMAAVMSWFTLSKIYRDCMGLAFLAARDYIENAPGARSLIDFTTVQPGCIFSLGTVHESIGK